MKSMLGSQGDNGTLWMLLKYLDPDSSPTIHSEYDNKELITENLGYKLLFILYYILFIN